MSVLGDEQLHDFVDPDENADGLYAYLVGDRYAVLHARDYPRGKPPIDWFIRRVQDRGAEDAEGPEFLCYNPGPEEFDAGGEATVREFIGLVDEARIVSLGDAPRWGDATALVEVAGDA